MDRKPKIERNKPFKGNLNKALRHFLHNDPAESAGKFWYLDPTAIAVENIKETQVALGMLKKHIPKQFHGQLRVALPKTVWELHVVDVKILKTLQATIPNILLPITHKIGFAPEIKPILHTNSIDWAKSGPILQRNPKNQRYSRNIASVKTLQTHIPESLHDSIRFLPPRTTWFIIVEKGVIAERVKALLFTGLQHIATDLGFEPTIRVAVQPSHILWRQSGFLLEYTKIADIERPNEDDAQQFLSDFIKK